MGRGRWLHPDRQRSQPEAARVREQAGGTEGQRGGPGSGQRCAVREPAGAPEECPAGVRPEPEAAGGGQEPDRCGARAAEADRERGRKDAEDGAGGAVRARGPGAARPEGAEGHEEAGLEHGALYRTHQVG
uniref:(northern house mosquito) hypothetical protein n=1 Tax=Culex pipiens TaxID=7175 RepID=A0A8D8HLK6_CULPI